MTTPAAAARPDTELFVEVAERVGACSVGEIQAAEDLATRDDRHPEVRRHGWMAGREAGAIGIFGDHRDPTWPKVLRIDTQQPEPFRK